MSSQTSIDNLPRNDITNKEDMDIVNNILNDLTKQNDKDELIEKQRVLEQQQREVVLEAPTEVNINSINKSSLDNMIDKLKLDFKNILLVVILAVFSNMEQSNNLLNYFAGSFVEGSTVLTMQGIIIKAIVIGVLYFIIKTQCL